jgi:YARHG domain
MKLRTVSALGAVFLAAATPAQAQSCADLWYQRNSIFKEAGYCFRTPRGVRAFGNAGCLYDEESEVPLSDRQRRIVAQIRATERAYGCR